MDVYHRRHHGSYKLNTKTERVVSLKTLYNRKLFTSFAVRNLPFTNNYFSFREGGRGEVGGPRIKVNHNR